MHIGEIKAIKEVEGGTLLKVFLPNAFLETQIERQKTSETAYVEVKIDDKRKITIQQRKSYYATLKDISNYTGHLTEYLHDYFKFLYKYLHEDINISMSDCTVTQAKEMITILIDFAIDNNVPLSERVIDRVEDVDRYIYKCIVKRLCIVDGRPNSDFHHTTAVGMGRDRKKIDHVGMKGFTLCRSCHNIIHQMGEEEFCKKHKVYPLTLDEYAIKKLKL